LGKGEWKERKKTKRCIAKEAKDVLFFQFFTSFRIPSFIRSSWWVSAGLGTNLFSSDTTSARWFFLAISKVV